MTDKVWLTTRQAAEYLGYSVHTLRYSRVTGTLGGNNRKPPKHYGQGGAIRYLQSDLEEWIMSGAENDQV